VEEVQRLKASRLLVPTTRSPPTWGPRSLTSLPRSPTHPTQADPTLASLLPPLLRAFSFPSPPTARTLPNVAAAAEHILRTTVAQGGPRCRPGRAHGAGRAAPTGGPGHARGSTTSSSSRRGRRRGSSRGCGVQGPRLGLPLVPPAGSMVEAGALYESPLESRAPTGMAALAQHETFQRQR